MEALQASMVDPQAEASKVSDLARWASEDLHVDGPEGFLRLINQIDLQTKGDTRHSLLDRAWKMMHTSRIKASMAQLLHG